MATFREYLKESYTPKKISKKEFTTLHKNGKLGLIAGGVKGDVKSVIQKLKQIPVDDMKPIKVSRVDVGNENATGLTQTVYNVTHDDVDFYILETRMDNSKYAGNSWDTLEYSCIVYIAL